MNREREAPLDVVIALERDSSAHAFFRSASVAFPGPRGRTSGADGLQRGGVLSASPAEAVRGCSPSAATGASRKGLLETSKNLCASVNNFNKRSSR